MFVTILDREELGEGSVATGSTANARTFNEVVIEL
jgi:hypothetical protein